VRFERKFDNRSSISNNSLCEETDLLVSPHTAKPFSKIQVAVDALPFSGGQICVLPGVYNESVLIDKRVDIRIHGCGPRSRIQAAAGPNGPPSPAFMISNATAITLEDLAIESGPESAVRINNARHVTVRRCLIQMRDLATIWQSIYSRGDDILKTTD
jgi:hypothetical protein